jgi:subtilisin-like proprotein convertase family protein
MRDTARKKTVRSIQVNVRIAVEIREDFTVALMGAQSETVARLQSLLEHLSRRNVPDNSGSSQPSEESKAAHAGVPLEITEVNR